ncbi:hypothetical protein GCM10007874_60100 [Labrys miyagiensis]|uniref:Uncharacterized protein n=1 Tax=Labrys miyagiensis TaxID=346912 RepID=A0ABQ6CVH4_9HYPH|nr:hypothetical protein [Labrys miyagiensis]GLS22990.1 hypothetical protein GCM10007874_60100 [Labrys miyagiensis]
MSTSGLPQEAIDALQDLSTNGLDTEISPPMLKILGDQGDAELRDGRWAVTDAGLSVLNDKLQDLPPYLGKAD